MANERSNRIRSQTEKLAKVPPILRFAGRYASEVKYPGLGLVIRKVDTSNSTSRWVGECSKQRARLGKCSLDCNRTARDGLLDFWRGIDRRGDRET